MRATVLLLFLAITACSGSGDSDAPATDAMVSIDASPDSGSGTAALTCAQLEQTISDKLDAASLDPNVVGTPDYVIMLQTEDGRTYTHSHGNAGPTVVYESASTSKLVTAVIIMDLVEQGTLTLETKAHDLIPFWTENTVTLRELMAFTSGYFHDPQCTDNPFGDFATCVQTIYTTNEPVAPPAGTVFQYAGSHLQVAGYMAMLAKGVGTWNELFNAWRTKTGMFPTGAYDLPSASNPRLAGGMHWTATEYLAFLLALEKKQILSDSSRAQLFANQRGSATLTSSPAWARVHEDWSYGLGNWLECPTATTLGNYNCGEGHRNSSPGSYGSYPFIDFDHHYVGMLARMGDRGAGFEGIQLFRAAGDEITTWADGGCER